MQSTAPRSLFSIAYPLPLLTCRGQKGQAQQQDVTGRAQHNTPPPPLPYHRTVASFLYLLCASEAQIVSKDTTCCGRCARLLHEVSCKLPRARPGVQQAPALLPAVGPPSLPWLHFAPSALGSQLLCVLKGALAWLVDYRTSRGGEWRVVSRLHVGSRYKVHSGPTYLL